MFKLYFYYQLGLARTSHRDSLLADGVGRGSGNMSQSSRDKARQKEGEYFVDCLYVQLLRWVWEKL